MIYNMLAKKGGFITLRDNHVRNVIAKLLSQVTKNVIIAYQMSFFDLKVFDQNAKVYGAQNIYGAHNF